MFAFIIVLFFVVALVFGLLMGIRTLGKTPDWYVPMNHWLDSEEEFQVRQAAKLAEKAQTNQ